MSARVIQVIEASELRGNGSSEHPFHTVTCYYALDGTKLAEHNALFSNTSQHPDNRPSPYARPLGRTGIEVKW